MHLRAKFFQKKFMCWDIVSREVKLNQNKTFGNFNAVQGKATFSPAFFYFSAIMPYFTL